MTAAARAVASLFMLLGFYVVALIQLVMVLVLVIWVATFVSGGLGVKLAVPLVLVVGAALVGLWRAVRAQPGPPHGLLVTSADAPELTKLVSLVAAEVGTRMPDEVRLVPEVNASVSEDTRLLGLVGGRRRLSLGMPLLLTMSVDQIRSVLAHELGHYSGNHTRLGAVAYRGRLAIEGSIRRIGRWNPVGWVFRGYARLYLLVDNATSRRQELEADRASVRVAGADVATSALRDLPVLDAAWHFYFDRYVDPGWEVGYVPDDLFGGFAELVEARRDEIDRLRAQEPQKHPSRWDTHPSFADRITVMAAAPPAVHRVDARRATALLPSPREAGLRLQREVLNVGDRTVLPWPEFTAAAITAGLQTRADRVFRSVGRLTGAPDPGLATLLDVVAEGRLPELAAEFFPEAGRDEIPQRFAGSMAAVLSLAAIRSGVARWQHCWSAPAALIDQSGTALDLTDVAKLAVIPETLGAARFRLAALGIRAEDTAVVERRATGRGAEVIGALANVKLGDEHADLVVLNRGLVVAPAPKSVKNGTKRLTVLLATTAAEELVARHRFLPFEEVVAATVVKRMPLRLRLALHGGESVEIHERWNGEQLKKSRDTLLEILDRLAAR